MKQQWKWSRGVSVTGCWLCAKLDLSFYLKCLLEMYASKLITLDYFHSWREIACFIA